MTIGVRHKMSSFAGLLKVRPAANSPFPTTCEVSYDTDFSSREISLLHRSSSSDSRTSFQDFIGSLYLDSTSVPHPSPREDSRYNRKASKARGTRSFTSLGTYNNHNVKGAGTKRGSISVWESRSMGHQSQCRVLSAGSPSRGSSQNGDISNQSRLRWVDALNTWVPDTRPSQAFVTFVNGAPSKQRGNIAVTTEDSLQCLPSTSQEMHFTQTKPEHSNPSRYRAMSDVDSHESLECQPSTSHEMPSTTTKPEHSNLDTPRFRSAGENVPCRPSMYHELHSTRAKPEHVNPNRHTAAVENVPCHSRTSNGLHHTTTKPEHFDPDICKSPGNIHSQRSDEIYVKVEKPRETTGWRVCRSQTALPTRNFTQKRTALRTLPPSRQSRSSAASLPPAPPPSKTPSKSANSNRSGITPYSEGNTGGMTRPTTVLESTAEENRPSVSLTLCGPGGDESCDSTGLDPQGDKDSSILSKPFTHSRHGSTSSINTDLSKTSSAYFMENILDAPVAVPVEIKTREVLTPVDRSPPGGTLTPSPIVLPSILSSPSPVLPVPVPAPVPAPHYLPDPESPPINSQEFQAQQRGITPSPPRPSFIPVSQSPPPVLDTLHERKKYGVRWDTESVTDKAGTSGNQSEQDDASSSIVNGSEDTPTAENTHLGLIPRPVTPQLSPIKETELAETLSRDITDGNKVILQMEETPNRASNTLPDVTKPVITRKPLPKKVKKERKPLKKYVPKTKIPTPPASPPPSESILSMDAIVSEVGAVEKESSFDTELPPVAIPDIPLPSIPEATSEQKHKIKNQMSLPPTAKPKKNVRHHKALLKHSSYDEERMRQELGEKRRKKQQIMLERLKMKTYPQAREETSQMDKDAGPRFEDYDFLAKYCIFDKGSHQIYTEAFQSVDAENPWLSRQQVIIALKNLNTKLSEVEDEYLWRILELMGYDVSKGADFKLFSVIAALSKRISSLDDWMKDLIGKIDFLNLEMKMDLWKTLWECNVDTESNTVSLDQLCVELQAGGISRQHEFDVRRKLGHLTSMDLLDFLKYIPLFVIIHESVVENPLSNRREK